MLKGIDICKTLHRFQSYRFVPLTNDITAEKANGAKVSKRKVKAAIELIRLIDTNDEVLGIKTMDEAMKLAKKKNVLLEPIEDKRFGKAYPVYKLSFSSKVFNMEFESVKSKVTRNVKRLTLTAKINDYDLNVKIKNIKKMLLKNCEIHVAVSGSSEPQSDTNVGSVFQKIKEQLGNEARFLDKKMKNEGIMFTILPPKVADHSLNE